QRPRRDRSGLFLFRLGGPGVWLFRHGDLPLLLVARCHEDGRSRAGRHAAADTGWPRRMVARLGRCAGLDAVCARWYRDDRFWAGACPLGAADPLGKMTRQSVMSSCSRSRCTNRICCYQTPLSGGVMVRFGFIIACIATLLASVPARAQGGEPTGVWL